MSTDFRALCAELAEELERYQSDFPAMTDKMAYRAMSADDVLIRARAALAEPEPEVVGPSSEEVEDLCEEHCFNVEGYESIECLQGLINDALSRWGRPAPAADADGPAVPDGREPASVADEPSNEELLEINDGAYCPGTNEVNDDDDFSWQYTSDHIRWLDENGTPQEQAAYAVKGLRAVFEAGRRWGRPAPVPAGEVAELVEWLRDRAESTSLAHNALRITRAADLLERLASPACVVLKPSPELIEAFQDALSGRIEPLLEQRHPAPVPVPVSVSEHPWERKGWCDEQGRCWFGWHRPMHNLNPAMWMLCPPDVRDFLFHKVCLPFNALPLPSGEVEP